MFDVTIGSFEGAEACELVGLFILNDLANKYGTNNIGLYREVGLTIFRNTTGPQAERTEGNNNKLQGTRTEDNNSKQLKIS